MTHYIEISSAVILFVLLLVGLRLTSKSRAHEDASLATGIASINEVRQAFELMNPAIKSGVVSITKLFNACFWPKGEPDWNWPR